MSATLEQTQQLPRHSGFAPVYARNRRDAIIIYGLLHTPELQEVNDCRFAQNETTLC